MTVLSLTERRSLVRRMEAYKDQLHSEEGWEAFDYLTNTRGLTPETLRHFQLGVAAEPLEADEPARNKISIPYLTPSGPVALRFRRPPSDEHGPKYWQPAGTVTSIFNVDAVIRGGSWIVICEGEIDAMTAVQAGLPAVGIPGASAWKPHYTAVFDGFERVIICADNDDKGAGEDFAQKVATSVPAPAIFKWPEGHDLNSFYMEHGAMALWDYLKLKHPEQPAAAEGEAAA